MRNTILTKTRRVESRSVRGLCTVVALKSLLCSPVLLPSPLLEPTGLELALVAAHRLLLLELVGAECGR